MDLNEKIIKMKKEYEVARTNHAVAVSKQEACITDMKKLGVTPKNIASTIEKLESKIVKDEKELNELVEEIDESLR